MKILRFLFVLLFSLTLKSNLFAQEYSPPGLEFTCELKVTIDPKLKLGATAWGERMIIPISGGTFEGPTFNGTVLPGGADYQKIYPDKGLTELEAIYTIKTDDGVLIHVRNVGIIYVPEKDKGSNVGASRGVYFRAAPKFEAPENSKYSWLNHAIFVCIAIPQKDYVSIQVWKIL